MIALTIRKHCQDQGNAILSVLVKRQNSYTTLTIGCEGFRGIAATAYARGYLRVSEYSGCRQAEVNEFSSYSLTALLFQLRS